MGHKLVLLRKIYGVRMLETDLVVELYSVKVKGEKRSKRKKTKSLGIALRVRNASHNLKEASKALVIL